MNTYRVLVCLLMLGSVAGVGERLAAAVLAEEGSLPGVAPRVDLQILQTGETSITSLLLQWGTCYVKIVHKAYN